MRLTPNQLILFLSIHRGTEVDETEMGTYGPDSEKLLTMGVIEPNAGDEPGHRLTQIGEDFMEYLTDAWNRAYVTETSTDLPELVPAGALGLSGEDMMLSDKAPTYLVANSLARPQDCRAEPALVRPPVTVYGSEARASERAIGLAASNRGLNFHVFRSLKIYRVDPVSIGPVRRF